MPMPTQPEERKFTESQVRSLISTIYSEFAERDRQLQNGYTLKKIIHDEVECHPVMPIKIFKP